MTIGQILFLITVGFGVAAASQSRQAITVRRKSSYDDLSDEYKYLLQLLSEDASTNGASSFYSSWSQLHEYDKSALRPWYSWLEGLGKELDARLMRAKVVTQLQRKLEETRPHRNYSPPF